VIHRVTRGVPDSLGARKIWRSKPQLQHPIANSSQNVSPVLPPGEYKRGVRWTNYFGPCLYPSSFAIVSQWKRRKVKQNYAKKNDAIVWQKLVSWYLCNKREFLRSYDAVFCSRWGQVNTNGNECFLCWRLGGGKGVRSVNVLQPQFTKCLTLFFGHITKIADDTPAH